MINLPNNLHLSHRHSDTEGGAGIRSLAADKCFVSKQRQKNGGHGSRGIEADQSKTFITRFNFNLQRVRRNKKSAEQQPRVGGAHNAQKRERKATKTLAIVLGSTSTIYFLLQ